MKMKIFFLILYIQIAVLLAIFIFIYRQHTKSVISITPLSKSMLKQSPNGTFNYFYEPKSDTTETVSREWLSYSPTYHINSNSLNERYNYDEKKGDDVFRIITLGDSFTFGAYVDTSDNWTELLEDYLNKVHTCSTIKKYEVINLGVDGYDTAYEVERYVRRGRQYKPNLIVMLITDFGRVTEHRLSRKREMPTLSIEQNEEYKKRGNYYAETNMYDGELSHEVRVANQMAHFKRLMSLYTNPLLLLDFSLNNTYLNDIKKLEKQYKSITLSRMELKRDDKRYILPDWHPNTEGHKKIMEEIAIQLKKNSLLPCK